MQGDQLDGLLALKLVAEKKNFTAAADELGISPSAISQTIKQLESRLGIALLNRTTRSTSLTEAGEQFLNQAGPAIEQILSALNNVGTYALKPTGLLRINTAASVWYSFLAPVVASFLKKYPAISVEVYFEDRQSDVVSSGFDAGIRLSDILQQDMVALKLFGPVRFVIVGAPKYLNKYGRPKTPKDLLEHNCIRVRLGGNYIYENWEFEHKGKDLRVHVKGNLILNDTQAILGATIDGLGLSYVHEEAVEDKIKSGKLEVVLGSYAATSAGFYLYYPKRSQVLPKLRVFIEHLKEHIHEK